MVNYHPHQHHHHHRKQELIFSNNLRMCCLGHSVILCTREELDCGQTDVLIIRQHRSLLLLIFGFQQLNLLIYNNLRNISKVTDKSPNYSSDPFKISIKLWSSPPPPPLHYNKFMIPTIIHGLRITICE